MKGTNERETAVRLLIEILGSGAYGNIALAKALNGLDSIQHSGHKGFITELVNGVVRNLLYIDYVIGLFSKTPVKKIKPRVLCILRAGLYQVLFLDRVPNSAACDESVKLTKAMGFGGLAGYVNGVMRNVSRNANNIALPDAALYPVEYLSLKYSYPEWLIQRFMRTVTGLQAMLEANAKPPVINICVNTLRTDTEALTDILTDSDNKITIERSAVCQNALRLTRVSDMRKLDGYKKGLFHVMSESSMLAVEALDVKPGQFMIDVCSAPGGKAFYAAELMQNNGTIISRDIHEHKLKLIKDGADRLGISIINTELADATATDARMTGLADRLLVDAPCSGLGIIGRKPDIKYTKSECDIRELAKLQRRILTACQDYVKPGGLMVYSTCTLTPEENMENMKWFIGNYNYRSESFGGGCGFMTLQPSANISDGFFIAKLRRLSGG